MYRIISFSDSKGVVNDYLATTKSIEYFNSDLNPTVVIDDIHSRDNAFGLESILLNELNPIGKITISS